MLCEEETISQCRVGVADNSRDKGASQEPIAVVSERDGGFWTRMAEWMDLGNVCKVDLAGLADGLQQVESEKR